jgi:hypothetical protein
VTSTTRHSDHADRSDHSGAAGVSTAGSTRNRARQSTDAPTEADSDPPTDVAKDLYVVRLAADL